MLRIATVNVNGIRAAARRGMSAWIDSAGADVLLLQEVRATAEQLEENLPGGWRAVAHPSEIKGRAGVAVAVATFAALGLSTSVIPNPIFGRSIPPTDWALEVLVVTSVLTGVLTATYVATPPSHALDRRGTAGALLAYFAIGCPVCNKLALLALGYTGAMTYFAPVQPFLAAAAVLLLGYALVQRLAGQVACSVTG